MKKTYVIGDIHGCYEPLVNMLQLIGNTEDTLIFLGDYIDRGPESKKVVDLLVQLKKDLPRVITLLGNHESMFLRFLNGRDQEFFMLNGGQETLESYGIDPLSDYEPSSFVPEEHLAFFAGLLLHWEDEKNIYVHAGLKPGLHLSLQTDWCIWARDEFIYSSCNFGKRVVFGHTVFKEPYVRPEKIGIDTGAVYGGNLTCLVLPDEEFITVAGHKNSNHHPLSSTALQN
ncbi:MAG: metallophosphoesterase family protein [Desulfobulbaceae bacterium]|nr:metallophosphoesterase family protein [Desulfobulbaceae bacterium]